MANKNVNENDNIIRFSGNRKRKKINILFFVAIFLLIYVIVVAISYFSTTHTVRYQVVEGSLASSTIYRGFVIRQEELVSNKNAGYVNYLAREGQRVAVGDLVYLVDESGNLADYIEAQSLGENTLTDAELAEFRTEIINFAHSYDNTDYDSVYDFKYSIKNTVSKLANTKLLDNMDSASAGNYSFEYNYSSKTGVVSYWYDGYEQINESQINKDIFDEKKYDKTQLLSNELRGIDEYIYKITTSEDWSIVFPVDEEIGEELLAEDYILTKFLKNQNESWGKVSLLHNEDETYLKLDFSNSMSDFVDERFLDIELILGDEVGLKIPVTSISEKEFFVIEEKYVKEDENDNYSVLMRVYNEDGTTTASAVNLEIYYYDSASGLYYVDDTILSAGDLLFSDDQDSFIVKDKGTLIGVYNINKGYADFKQITILYQNEDYAIVKSNTTYGLRVYDYIALDADTVDDDQFISTRN